MVYLLVWQLMTFQKEKFLFRGLFIGILRTVHTNWSHTKTNCNCNDLLIYYYWFTLISHRTLADLWFFFFILLRYHSPKTLFDSFTQSIFILSKSSSFGLGFDASTAITNGIQSNNGFSTCLFSFFSSLLLLCSYSSLRNRFFIEWTNFAKCLLFDDGLFLSSLPFRLWATTKELS